MLKAPSEFPHPGATAYVAPHGEAVRIIQTNADGSHLVARQRHPAVHSASDTYRAEPGTLFATQEAAISKRPRNRRAA